MCLGTQEDSLKHITIRSISKNGIGVNADFVGYCAVGKGEVCLSDWWSS